MNEDAMSAGASPRPASRTLGDLVDEMATATPGAEALVFRDRRGEFTGCTFARVSAALGMRVEDYYIQGRRGWVRLHEGGKLHVLPATITSTATSRSISRPPG
jgi:hypothetical protein